MTTFLIERKIPNAARLTQDDLVEIAKTSNAVVESLGVPYDWIHSHVAGDKNYYVHETEDVETIREHARRGTFPADLVVEVANVIDADTANATV